MRPSGGPAVCGLLQTAAGVLRTEPWRVIRSNLKFPKRSSSGDLQHRLVLAPSTPPLRDVPSTCPLLRPDLYAGCHHTGIPHDERGCVVVRSIHGSPFSCSYRLKGAFPKATLPGDTHRSWNDPQDHGFQIPEISCFDQSDRKGTH